MLLEKTLRKLRLDDSVPDNIMEMLVKDKCKETLLLEKLVKSSWLKTVTYYGKANKVFPGEDFLTFKTKDSPTLYICRFYIPGECKRFYKRWTNPNTDAGKFWWWVRRLLRRDWFKTIPYSHDKYGVPQTAKPFQIIKY